MDIEKKFHVFICGPNNSTLENIKQQTGAKVGRLFYPLRALQ